jgi:phasin family protein
MSNAPTFHDVARAHIDGLYDLAQTAFSGVEQLSHLNLQVARNTLAEARVASLALATATDLPTVITLGNGWLQAAPEKAAAYLQQVHTVLTGLATQARQSAERSAAEAQQRLAAALDAALKGAPADVRAAAGRAVAAR